MKFIDLGKLPFEEFLVIQKSYILERQWNERPDTIIFAEHPPTISLGSRNDNEQLKYLRVTRGMLYQSGIPIVKTERGGSLAVHGPGILGCYFILRLSLPVFINDFVSRLIHLAQDSLAVIGINAEELPDTLKVDRKDRAKYLGLWVKARKIVPIGLRLSRNITSFGMNINLSPDEELMRLIHPCGITEYELTSVKAEGGNYDRTSMVQLITKFSLKYLA